MKVNKVLVIYSCLEYPTRRTIWNNIYTFEHHGLKIFYVNLPFRYDLKLLSALKFDIVIFHHSVTAPWNLSRFEKNTSRLKKRFKGIKIKAAFFQDEHYRSRFKCKFINDLGITHAFSVSPLTELNKIYDSVNLSKIKFFQVLAGYINSNDVKYVENKQRVITKDIDIGYRTVAKNSYALGSFGYLKELVADVFQDKAVQLQIKTDIKKGLDNMILDNKWYDFLLRCKYTVGAESGSSVLDKDGDIKKCVSEFIRNNPDATFENVKKSCFKSLDRQINITAVSPRHLEACMTKTCQILVKGNYSGVLKPWIHYIPLKYDLSNIDKVLKIVKEDKLREDIVKKAYEDIVKSGKYSQKAFSDFVYKSLELESENSWENFTETVAFYINKVFDVCTWVCAGIYSNVLIKLFRRIKCQT